MKCIRESSDRKLLELVFANQKNRIVNSIDEEVVTVLKKILFL